MIHIVFIISNTIPQTSLGFRGHLITNFPHIMVLVCNIIVNEGIASGVLPVLNAV